MNKKRTSVKKNSGCAFRHTMVYIRMAVGMRNGAYSCDQNATKTQSLCDHRATTMRQPCDNRATTVQRPRDQTRDNYLEISNDVSLSKVKKSKVKKSKATTEKNTSSTSS